MESKELFDAGNSVLKSLRILGSGKQNRSITRLSKESIMQYPVLISKSIDLETASQIVKGNERQMAAYLMVYLSSNNIVNMAKYETVGDFLKKFNNTSALPKNLDYLEGPGMDALTGLRRFFGEAKESYNDISTNEDYVIDAMECTICGYTGKQMTQKQVCELWSVLENQVTMESLNDKYKPFTKTAQALENALATYEALSAPDFEPGTKHGVDADTSSPYYQADHPKVESPKPTPQSFTNTAISFNKLAQSSKKVEADKAIINSVYSGQHKAPLSRKGIEDRQFIGMEPTLVDCDFVLTGKGYDSRVLPITFAVKSMVRTISSDLMVSNIVQGLVENNLMFKFVKWTKGELRFIKDLILGVSEAKRDAQLTKGSSKVFANLRSMSRKAKMAKLTGSGVPLTTTIVITDLEATTIQDATGIDLRSEKNAIAFMNKQFLLGFGIYNEVTNSVSMIYDGEDYFTEVSIPALKSSNSKDNTMDTITQITKLMGR